MQHKVDSDDSKVINSDSLHRFYTHRTYYNISEYCGLLTCQNLKQGIGDSICSIGSVRPIEIAVFLNIPMYSLKTCNQTRFHYLNTGRRHIDGVGIFLQIIHIYRIPVITYNTLCNIYSTINHIKLCLPSICLIKYNKGNVSLLF